MPRGRRVSLKSSRSTGPHTTAVMKPGAEIEFKIMKEFVISRKTA